MAKLSFVLHDARVRRALRSQSSREGILAQLRRAEEGLVIAEPALGRGPSTARR